MQIDELFFAAYLNRINSIERAKRGYGKHIFARVLRAKSKHRAKGRKVYELANHGGHF